MLALTKSPHSHRVLEYSCVNFTMRPSTFNTAWWFPKEKCSPCHNNILFQEQKIFTGFTLDAEMHVWRKFCHQIIISYLSILQKSVEGQIGKDSANIDFARTSYSYNQNEINWHFKAKLLAFSYWFATYMFLTQLWFTRKMWAILNLPACLSLLQILNISLEGLWAYLSSNI